MGIKWNIQGNKMVLLTIFYDGTCPLCAKEMAALRKKDSNKNIKTVDIFSDDMVGYPEIDITEANTILHALDQDRKLLLGLDGVHRAWQIVGKGWLYAPLRWPLIKPIADKLYRVFATHRFRFSLLLTGRSRCNCKE